MSTVKTKNVQVGTDGTASNNFTIYVPGTPDGTVRIGNGDAGAVTDAVTINSSGAVTLANNLSVTGNISTSGTIPAAQLTGALPAIDGSALTNLSAGIILQVVNKTISTQGSQTIGTSDTQVGAGTDFDISITPTGNGSKFIVSARWFGEVTAAWNVVFNMQRDGVRINTGGSSSGSLGLSLATHSYSAAATNDSSTPEVMHLQTVDSTGSTVGTPITYTLVASGAANYTMWTNRTFASSGTGYETGISELTVMEVAG